jgi:hypothetical protein
MMLEVRHNLPRSHKQIPQDPSKVPILQSQQQRRLIARIVEAQ